MEAFSGVSPTRGARNGWALGKGAESDRINLRNARFRQDAEPIDGTCGCHTCRTCSRAYLHHLIRAGELLSTTLVSIHNIFTMNRLMGEVRQAIRSRDLDAR